MGGDVRAPPGAAQPLAQPDWPEAQQRPGEASFCMLARLVPAHFSHGRSLLHWINFGSLVAQIVKNFPAT